MKTTKILTTAALALMMTACSDNIDSALQPKADGEITVTAKIDANDGSALTRAVNDNGTTITSGLAVDEQIAVLFSDGTDNLNRTATVKSITDGTATIEFTIPSTLADNTAATLVYPASAAKADNTDVKTYAELFATQAGALSADLDVRRGTATILNDGETASLSAATKLAAQNAIVKFSLTDGTNAISASQFLIKDGSNNVLTTVTPATATNELYVVMAPATTSAFKFEATNGTSIFVYDNNSATLAAGNYYQSPMAMELTMGGHRFVDMGEVDINGVTKHLYWATCNVGADNPWDYGGYYAWGETATKDTYTWANYPFMQDGQSDWKHITKYTFADGQTAAIWYDGGGNFIGDGKTSFADYDYADDAARQIWGGDWRVPTDAEWTALRNTTLYDWVWTTDYNGSGKNGMLVTRKTGPCSGNSIFLPAAGYRFDSDLYFEGVNGYYWSSSLSTDSSVIAWRMNFYSGGVYRNYDGRFYGNSLRPVFCERYPLAAADVSSVDIGKVLAADGNIYADAAQASAAGTTARAVIAYVGSVPNYFDKFLAIAMTDVSADHKWAASMTGVGGYAATHAVTIGGTTYNTNAIGSTCYDQVTNNPNITSATRTTGVVKGWRLPSVTDWRYIFDGLGRQKAGLTLTNKKDDGSIVYCNNVTPTDPLGVVNGRYYYKDGDADGASSLRAAINAACGNEDLQSGDYWSSSEYDDMEQNKAWYYRFYYGKFSWTNRTTYDCYARAVFAY